ncbi:MAG: hypothetical protein EOM91_24365, partial [Sphingobacteriia bacterium]|nr:hypothetical protein [Sphingobacteriia bacterium]
VAQTSAGAYPYRDDVRAAAAKHGVPEWALAGVLSQESGFNPNAIGDNDSSWGMGQFNKHGAAADFGLSKEDILAMSPGEQIDRTGEFLARKLKQAGGDIDRALDLYNGGGTKGYRDLVKGKGRALGLMGGGSAASRSPHAGKPSVASEVFSAPGMDIDYRGDPSFQYGKSASANAKPFSGIVFHDPGSDASLDQLVDYGKSVDGARGGAFGYHFYVDRDGKIVQGAPMDKRTNHIKPNSKFGMSNSDTLGISLIGAQHGATREQLEAARELGGSLAKEYGIDGSRIFGHGEIQGDKRKDEGSDAAAALRESLNDQLPSDIPVGDPVSQRIGTSLRQEPSPPISLSLSMYQNPVTGAFHVEADRQG